MTHITLSSRLKMKLRFFNTERHKQNPWNARKMSKTPEVLKPVTESSGSSGDYFQKFQAHFAAGTRPGFTADRPWGRKAGEAPRSWTEQHAGPRAVADRYPEADQ